MRTIAVSVLLGLPAAILAHAAVFHGAHNAGGAMHGTLVLVSIVCAALAAACALAPASWPRLGISTPPIAGIIASAATWFAFMEMRESPHTVALLPCLVAICLAAWILMIAWRGFARIAAGPACQFFARLRPPFQRYATIFRRAVRAFGSLSPAYRLFSRPPPV